ncbi:MAG: cytochrome C oxidase Cbb3, partial [bacterium]|nr:cytochrome C oxidase Cbb3 [bacterium]
MHRLCAYFAATTFAGALLPSLAAAGDFDPALSYAEHCAECHGVRRYGGYAPPLIPATLSRKQDEVLVRGILEGLPSTQMPAFGEKLDEGQVRAIVELLRESPGDVTWSLADVAASRLEERGGVARLAPEIRRENLVLVVERGSGSVVVLDGDDMRELDRFPVG